MATTTQCTDGRTLPQDVILRKSDGTDGSTVLDLSFAQAITSNTITRPADTTAYAVGDLVANSTTAGSVTPFSFANAVRADGCVCEVTGVRLYKSSTSITNANFRVHFYRASVTPSNGDNGAWLTSNAEYLGAFDVTTDLVFSNGAEGYGIPRVGVLRKFMIVTGTTLYALLEARGAYTPANAETFRLVAELSRF